MEKITASQQLVETNKLEQRLAQWRQDYQRYLQYFAEFRQWQAGFNSQMALHEQHLRILQEIHTDLRRETPQAAFRRATRP